MKTRRNVILLVALAVLISGVAVFSANASSNSGEIQGPVAPSSAVANTADLQTIEAPVTAWGYPDITLEAGKPVNINFKAGANDLSGCNNELVIPDLGVDLKLKVGDNIITVTPTKTGPITYTCWMGMIQATINVVETSAATQGDASANAVGATAVQAPSNASSRLGCACCGR